MSRVVGVDQNGIKRVYGDGSTQSDATAQCELAAFEYVQRRPDVGTLRLYYVEQDGSLTDLQSEFEF